MRDAAFTHRYIPLTLLCVALATLAAYAQRFSQKEASENAVLF
jgi:hypothetical protein